MVLKSIVFMRHGEREDRAMEKAGKDWISTAERPQDPKLSEVGCIQASKVGRKMKEIGITKILTSPLIRTVMTADYIAKELGLGANSICIEHGLVEQARSFRGKDSSEPLPNWNPLLLPIEELAKFSDRIDMSYKTLVEVKHVFDASKPNTIREEHATLTDGEEITKDRYISTLKRVMASEIWAGQSVLCVGHGASMKAFVNYLENGLEKEERTKGERITSCWAEFVPQNREAAAEGAAAYIAAELDSDVDVRGGPWVSVSGVWLSGNDAKQVKQLADHADDVGDLQMNEPTSHPTEEELDLERIRMSGTTAAAPADSSLLGDGSIALAIQTMSNSHSLSTSAHSGVTTLEGVSLPPAPARSLASSALDDSINSSSSINNNVNTDTNSIINNSTSRSSPVPMKRTASGDQKAAIRDAGNVPNEG